MSGNFIVIGRLRKLFYFVSAEFQAGCRILKTHDKKNQKFMMSFNASLLPVASWSSSGSNIICMNRNTSFVVKEQGILLQFWNSVGRMKLTGVGLGLLGMSLNFPGIFTRMLFF